MAQGYNAKVEDTKQKLHLGGCSGQQTTEEYRKAWKIGMGACGAAIGDHRNTKQMRHPIVQRGGGLLDVVVQWGGEGGAVQLVSHCVKTYMDGKMKAKHRRHHATKYIQVRRKCDT